MRKRDERNDGGGRRDSCSDGEWQDSYRSDRCAPRPVAWGEPVITRKVLDKMWPW